MTALTIESLMRSWPDMTRDRAAEIIVENERHDRECPCRGSVKGHEAGWRNGDRHSPQAAIGYRRWMDHRSTTRRGGRRIYMCQPYANATWGTHLDKDAADFDRLRILGWTVTVSREDSRHVPGATVLITLVPPVKVKL